MKVLHFMDDFCFNVRLQRYLQSNLDVGFTPFVFHRKVSDGGLWISGAERVQVEFYEFDRRLANLYVPFDYLGLKRVFDGFGCDVVHAHSLWSAYYSFCLGLPTVFDDWEFWYSFLDCSPLFQGKVSGWFFAVLRKLRVKGIVKRLLRSLPVIVTNWNVKGKYEALGAENCFVVPNVPLRSSVEFALSGRVHKNPVVSTCYVGSVGGESAHLKLRDLTGVREFWSRNSLGLLRFFGGERCLGHLELMREIRRFHFNLLCWRPLGIHRFYLQNKAFLASAVGVPTIISDSLTATIDLLGEYALPVHCLSDVPRVMKSYSFPVLGLKREHVWETYESEIRKAYGVAC